MIFRTSHSGIIAVLVTIAGCGNKVPTASTSVLGTWVSVGDKNSIVMELGTDKHCRRGLVKWLSTGRALNDIGTYTYGLGVLS
jgi:hypothetical protein